MAVAMPSMRLSASAPPPSPSTKAGSSGTTISEPRSVKKLTSPSSTTLRGSLRASAGAAIAEQVYAWMPDR